MRGSIGIGIGIGALGAAALAAGCYSPALRDCTVTCTGADQCASGQVCGADGFCSAPDVAGTCVDAHVGIDAPVSTFDARFDAAPPDAPSAYLHITISGKGKVTDSVDNISCQTADCSFGVKEGATLVLTATGSGPQHPFQAWTTDNCKGQGSTCAVLIVAPVTLVSAAFK
jgi:hypothetical protein